MRAVQTGTYGQVERADPHVRAADGGPVGDA